MKRLLLLLTLGSIMASFSSCIKLYQEKIYQTIEPNETAFVLPLEGDNKAQQGKFDSEDYLEKNKVAAKRIEVPTRWHSSGRLSSSGKYIPTVRIVIVDRAPVTRKWLYSEKKNNDLNVESKESIAFGVGVTITASIPEKYASKFLYRYSGKELDDVVEQDIRPFIQGVLTQEFGTRDLSFCQEERKVVYQVMRDKTKKYFANYGIEILQIGAVGGFQYESPKIQAAIDAKFESAQKVISAQNEVDAANLFVKSASAIKKQKDLEAEMEIKEALAEAIRKGKLLPQGLKTLVIGSDSDLMQVYGATKL